MVKRAAQSKPPIKSYHHGDLRNALIGAGQALLAEEGIAGFDLRKVARRVGVSHAAPYRHFPDKQALLAAIAEEGFRQLTARLHAAVSQTSDDLVDRLQALARAYVRFGLDNPAWLREMFSGLTVERSAYPPLYRASKEALAELLQVVEQGQARGEVAAGPSMQLSIVVWAQVHGLAMLLIENQIPEVRSSERAITQTIDVCIQTLGRGLKRK